MEKVFVSHGDIILDKIYDADLHLVQQDGGGCNWNDLYNLAIMGESCYAIGSRGNDTEGEIAIRSLEKAGVNTDAVIVENKPTNIMNIIIPKNNLEDNSIIHAWYSPISNRYTMNFSENLPTTIPEKLKDKEVFIILDKFLPVNLALIEHFHGKKKVCLDIGHIRFFEHFSKQYLMHFLQTASFIQLNNTVLDLLYERLNVQTDVDFFKQFHLDLLIITEGKKGATYIFQENNEIKTIHQSPKTIVDIVDSSGAGDAFFSTTLREYAYSNTIDTAFIEKTFALANKASRDIIMQLGSRQQL